MTAAIHIEFSFNDCIACKLKNAIEKVDKRIHL